MKWLEKVHLKELISETFILVLLESGTKNHGENGVSVNKYGVKWETMLRFWENKGWINEIDPYGWFQLYFRYWLGRRSEDHVRQINRWKRIVSRFRGKLVKMIKDAGSKYDDY